MCEYITVNKGAPAFKSGFMLMMVLVLMLNIKSVYAEDNGTDLIESAYPLKITLDTEKLEGFIVYNLCKWDAKYKKSRCGLERLAITPQTVAYANYKKVPLRLAKSRQGRSAEIVYYKSDLRVKTISW